MVQAGPAFDTSLTIYRRMTGYDQPSAQRERLYLILSRLGPGLPLGQFKQALGETPLQKQTGQLTQSVWPCRVGGRAEALAVTTSTPDGRVLMYDVEAVSSDFQPTFEYTSVTGPVTLTLNRSTYAEAIPAAQVAIGGVGMTLAVFSISELPHNLNSYQWIQAGFGPITNPQNGQLYSALLGVQAKNRSIPTNIPRVPYISRRVDSDVAKWDALVAESELVLSDPEVDEALRSTPITNFAITASYTEPTEVGPAGVILPDVAPLLPNPR